jgi:hypothetical protein
MGSGVVKVYYNINFLTVGSCCGVSWAIDACCTAAVIGHRGKIAYYRFSLHSYIM